MRRSLCTLAAIIFWMIAGVSGALGLTADDLKPLAEDDFDAKSQAIDRVIACFKEVGLADEGEAISRAHRAWEESDGNQELTAMAYASARPRLGEQERFEHMVCYLVDNADRLFYVGAEA